MRPLQGIEVQAFPGPHAHLAVNDGARRQQLPAGADQLRERRPQRPLLPGPQRDVAGDATRRGRFHPFQPGRTRTPLPMLYAADTVGGALSETVFHDVPVRGPAKRIPYSQLQRRVVTSLIASRELTLVDLTSDGLSRLGLTRLQLIESGPRAYPSTAAWARALHDHPPALDGLMWVSRQQDTSRAVVLFGDRVAVSDLDVAPDTVPLVLGAGQGLITVSAAANRAGITITGIADAAR